MKGDAENVCKEGLLLPPWDLLPEFVKALTHTMNRARGGWREFVAPAFFGKNLIRRALPRFLNPEFYANFVFPLSLWSRLLMSRAAKVEKHFWHTQKGGG